MNCFCGVYGVLGVNGMYFIIGFFMEMEIVGEGKVVIVFVYDKLFVDDLLDFLMYLLVVSFDL